jgi:peptidoglycan/xylan/chitin deacetylase (PgdA/CDA1 family)
LKIKIGTKIFLSIIFIFATHGKFSCDKADCSWKDEELTLCNSIPIAVPTDSEKKFVYNRVYNDKINYKKGVFLTFDDGPSKNTLKILDTLNENNIKATFFVLGKSAEHYPDIIRKVNDSGMCILPHSYSHNYVIYKSLRDYIDDFNSCNDVIASLINESTLPFVRFPGGSTNSIWNFDVKRQIKETLNNKKVKYIDWNVSSADAAAVVVEMDKIKSNVINQCKNKDMAVVLMHDAPTKVTTAEALPYIIKDLKERGYVFRSFEDISEAEERELIKRKIINR